MAWECSLPMDVSKSHDLNLLHQIALEFQKQNFKKANALVEEARKGGINICLADDGLMATTTDSLIVAVTLSDMKISVLEPNAAEGPAWLPIITSPPAKAARLLSYLLSPDRLQEALGDFDEGYALMLERHDIGHACRWYWIQVIKLIVWGLFGAACKVAKIWGGFGPA